MKILSKEKRYLNTLYDVVLNFTDNKSIEIKLVKLCKALESHIHCELSFVAIDGFGDVGEPKFHREIEAPFKANDIYIIVKDEELEKVEIYCNYRGLEICFVIWAETEEIRVILEEQSIDIENLLKELENSITLDTFYAKHCNENGKYLIDYFLNEKKLSVARAISVYEKLARYQDIFNEFSYYVKTREFMPENNCIHIEGYSAKTLCESTYLTPLGAYNYLISLRENPKEAMNDLKNGLPRK